ncbi:MAG TPA: ABC transporter ATP-binding protein [Candidatus Acidoferrales bacterium]|nr:ABC transporter ATP-binding protein [Candidatus Acidoferrales bacterium]
MESAAILTVRDLTIRFGGLAALSGVSFDVQSGRITGLIGPNGAGKTTCFNCITRLYQPDAGTIRFKDGDLLRVAAHRIAGRGIARTFQNLELFGTMTALENVTVGVQARRRNARTARELLDYVGQSAVANRPVRTLPFGARKMVELARALGSAPELLLLDEPAAGFSHDEIAALAQTIERIPQDFQTTVLMVEHHMQLVMRICRHIIVLDAGQKLAEGDPSSITSNRAVVEAYLGTA